MHIAKVVLSSLHIALHQFIEWSQNTGAGKGLLPFRADFHIIQLLTRGQHCGDLGQESIPLRGCYRHQFEVDFRVSFTEIIKHCLKRRSPGWITDHHGAKSDLVLRRRTRRHR